MSAPPRGSGPIRAALTLTGTALGLLLASSLLSRGLLTGPNTLLYLSLLGGLLAYLASAPLSRRLAQLSRRFRRGVGAIPPEVVLAAGIGATVALLVTVLLNNLLAAVPGFTWYWSLLIAVVLVSASSWFFVTNRQLLPLGRTAGEPRIRTLDAPRTERLLDTSALIDGRIVDVIEANFLDGRLLVPRFVLAELQRIADSDDPLRRRRGRRGLEVLDRLVQVKGIRTSVIADDPADVDDVDGKLVRLGQERGADLITTDFNLNRVAALQGVRVLNVNELANAVKAMYLPGERLALTIVKPGREPGQGLAYLEDGTMVVVEDAADQVGTSLEVVVTSSLQTQMGRMIFARPDGVDAP